MWTAKRAALEIIAAVPLTGRRQAAYQRFREREGGDLDDWATWCALAELHGPDWRKWPDSAKDPRSAAAADADGRLGDQPAFHAWLQWLLDEQLAGAQQEAKAAGMDTGIIHDLAVGVNPAGADAWAQQDLLVPGLNVGAPPDGFNQRGQDWAQPPWHPQRLAAARYRPLADLFGAALRYAGGLRVDHVMGLRRLWCVPAGMPPDCGAYVQYDYGAEHRGAGRRGGPRRRTGHRRGPRHRRALVPHVTWPTTASSAPRCSGSPASLMAPRCGPSTGGAPAWRPWAPTTFRRSRGS